eukprot:TRINITY_DN1268_c7_g1_i1.p1 TRINITY_DN1268_c7_g1~~TRINITY_DN1268_c7_g1_i1.p1  ORF type:complete len:494 (+),score=95.19 TRINITY_DN1268_c7_g1_i1:57-1538(+)
MQAVLTTAVMAAATPPNIIFILSDDLGFGDYSISNPVNRTIAAIPTPNIQKLADNGIKFERSYSGPVCAPSRCTLMTGRHLGHCTIRGNDGSYSPLLPSDITVAKALQGVYNTALIGKWGLGDWNTTGYPLAQGFDYFIGQDSQVSCHNWYPETFQNQTNGTAQLPQNAGSNLGPKCLDNGATCYWSNDMFKNEAIRYIKNHAHQEKPFFLYLSSTTPHVGNLKGVASEYPVPYGYRQEFKNETWSAEQQLFASAVVAQDDMVGAVLDVLVEENIEENTVVWFSGDNGPDSHPFTLFDDPGYFRGKKRSLHEGGIRQTIAIQWKGTVPPKSDSNHMLAFWDLLPTAVELAGLPPVANVDGVSIAKLLKTSSQTEKHEYLYWEFCEPQDINGLLPQVYAPGWIQAVRFDDGDHQWKVIRTNGSDDNIYVWDLSVDISESNDLGKNNTAVVNKALSYMKGSHVEDKFWKSGTSASPGCCASCFKHGGCPAPCVEM